MYSCLVKAQNVKKKEKKIINYIMQIKREIFIIQKFEFSFFMTKYIE